ncbi:MAG: prenyltransferase/squalene oxidase repeat-containing protein [Planctomycetota bacterium]
MTDWLSRFFQHPAFLPVIAAEEAPDAGERKKDEVRRRVVGSIVFPPRNAKARELSAPKLLTPDVREMTEKALKYVCDSQQADGSWGDKEYPKSTRTTALCCMALLAQGNLPRVGHSGKTLDRGIGFLLSRQKDDGLVVAKDTYIYGPMYDHVWATLVLLQSYGNCPWYADARTKISRALQAILKAQKPDGGWRYGVSPLGRSCVPVTADVMTTLRLGRLAGFGVPEQALRKAEAFVLRCRKPTEPGRRGTFSYREHGAEGIPSVTAAGLVALFSRGRYEHEYVQPCIDQIEYAYRRAHLDDFGTSHQFRNFHHGGYYVSQVMYIAGDEYWLPWYRKFAEYLKATQADDGSFRDRRGNRVSPTAISALVLQAPLGYMPQYLR